MCQQENIPPLLIPEILAQMHTMKKTSLKTLLLQKGYFLAGFYHPHSLLKQS